MGSNHDKELFNKYGQFMTQDKLVDFVLDKVNKINKIKGNILEPSFGKGAFINGLLKYDYDKIDAYEIDDKIYNQVHINKDKVNLYLDDFILSSISDKYDHIIGNPPYVETNYSYYKPEQINKFKKQYKEVSNGRLNLVHMFIAESYNLLKDNGYLSFLLPSVILTSPYYKKLRKYIYDNFNIEYVKNDVSFDGVTIKVSLLIMKKIKDASDKYFVNYDNNYYITEEYENYPKHNRTLRDLGFNVNIGNICWNHHKDEITDDSNYTPIIYTKNIVNNEVKLGISLDKKGEKKQYIKDNNIRYKDFIALPRTTSNKTKVLFIKNNNKYQVENHLLIITHSDIKQLEKLHKMFMNEKVDKYIKLFNTSSTISVKEILSIPME